MADMVMLPAKPISAITADITAAIHHGAVEGRGPPQQRADQGHAGRPPSNPSQVRDALIVGTITCLPPICDQAYCNASLSCTIRIKKNSSRTVPPSAAAALVF